MSFKRQKRPLSHFKGVSSNFGRLLEWQTDLNSSVLSDANVFCKEPFHSSFSFEYFEGEVTYYSTSQFCFKIESGLCDEGLVARLHLGDDDWELDGNVPPTIQPKTVFVRHGIPFPNEIRPSSNKSKNTSVLTSRPTRCDL